MPNQSPSPPSESIADATSGQSIPVLRIASLVMLVGLIVCKGGSLIAFDVTAAERSKVTELRSRMSAAGKLFAKGDLDASATSVSAVQSDLSALLRNPDPVLHRLAKPIYAGLSRAHGLLELEGIELQPLPTWEMLIAQDEPSSPKISFVKDVAPWLVSRCGRCHIDNTRGGFSLANFRALATGTQAGVVYFPGSARGSRLVEVLESGDMPRGGGSVSDDQLAALKTWIDQGAKFDGPTPSSPLREYIETPASSDRQRPTVQLATGTESVSFAQDVAPILATNCNGCHIAGRRASGNLRMDNFEQLLRGGDSGSPIDGTNASASLLVRKLKGEEGRRMPAGGRDPLSAEEIATIETWIREGSKFDGPTPRTSIGDVVAQAWAVNASHVDLFARRKEQALEQWSRVLPGKEPATLQNDELFILGNVPEQTLADLLASFEEAIEKTRKLLKATSDKPLVQGGLVVYVLRNRYDYSEFGRMTEGRELPKSWAGHWEANAVHAYGAISADGVADEKATGALALRITAGAYVGSFSGVPNWFAEGVARNLVATSLRRRDPLVATWQKSLPAAMARVENSKVLQEGRIDEETTGLVGMKIAEMMMSRANRGRFDQLLSRLRSGKTFSEAHSEVFGPPETLLKSLLGK